MGLPDERPGSGRWLISPLAGEMSGRPEGGAVPPAYPLCLSSTLPIVLLSYLERIGEAGVPSHPPLS
ncbi:MAG: hypothetical protein E5X33_25180, partial [Mesorhizobium sp.]